MQQLETGSCSSDLSTDALHWNDEVFTASLSARRSNRKRSFSKCYDVDLARMLGGKHDAASSFEEFSSAFADNDDSDLTADFASVLYEPDNLEQLYDNGRADPAPVFSAGQLKPEEFSHPSSAFEDLLQVHAIEQDFFGESSPFFQLEADNEFYNSINSYVPDTSDASSPCCAEPQAAAQPESGKKSVLVAKVLTKSDAHAKRVILPRVAVEANLSVLLDEPTFVMSAKDSNGKDWRFVVKSWSNGHNPKPVYVMEQVADYLRHYHLGVGDAVGILMTTHGLLIEHNTSEVRSAAERPTYCGFTRDELTAVLLKSKPGDQQTSAQFKSAGATTSSGRGSALQQTNGSTVSCADNIAHMGGVLLCLRTSGCSRPAGHQGWCSGHKGFKRRRNAEVK